MIIYLNDESLYFHYDFLTWVVPGPTRIQNLVGLSCEDTKPTIQKGSHYKNQTTPPPTELQNKSVNLQNGWSNSQKNDAFIVSEKNACILETINNCVSHQSKLIKFKENKYEFKLNLI